jgi:hypothetical protein
MFGTFPFTFKLSVPGLSNPFSVPPVTPPELPPVQDRTGLHDDAQKRPRRQRPSPSPTPSLSPPPQQPLSRKRGWEPTFAEPSRSTATLASSAGYLDTPAKYRELMSPSTPNDHEYHDITMSDTPGKLIDIEYVEFPIPLLRFMCMLQPCVSHVFITAISI